MEDPGAPRTGAEPGQPLQNKRQGPQSEARNRSESRFWGPASLASRLWLPLLPCHSSWRSCKPLAHVAVDPLKDPCLRLPSVLSAVPPALLPDPWWLLLLLLPRLRTGMMTSRFRAQTQPRPTCPSTLSPPPSQPRPLAAAAAAAAAAAGGCRRRCPPPMRPLRLLCPTEPGSGPSPFLGLANPLTTHSRRVPCPRLAALAVRPCSPHRSC